MYVQWMFFIERLNLSNFNTNNVTYMRSMSSGCSDQFKNKIGWIEKD